MKKPDRSTLMIFSPNFEISSHRQALKLIIFCDKRLLNSSKLSGRTAICLIH